MAYVGEQTTPFLKISSVLMSSELAPYLRKKNAYVGVEFPDSYMVLKTLILNMRVTYEIFISEHD